MTLRFIRTWLPALIVALGVGLWIAHPTVETAIGSAGIVGAGIGIWMINVLFRIGVQGDLERDDEDAARRFLDEHGHWPDEKPPGGAPPAPSDPPTASARPRTPRRPS
ncbi:MAG: hypothetical protein JWP17_4147 [Solirubrobacterales bacterium]|nr:hypothetical protein [Solirubrobacterales bacterium]